MRGVYYTEFGSPDVLLYGEIPKPSPGRGQVLIEVHAAGVNPIDIRLRAGERQEFFRSTFPVVAGWDVSGRIVAIGEGVELWQVGDDVVGLGFTYTPHHGSYAEYMVIDSSALARKPESISFEHCAALPLISLTAWQALTEIGKVVPGNTVFISAGAGGLGSAAIALASHLGGKVYTTTRAVNFEYVCSLGTVVPIDYTSGSFSEKLLAVEPDGVDVLLELLDSSPDTITITKTGGSAIFMNDYPPETADIAARNINAVWLHHRAEGSMLADILSLYASGQVRSPEITVMPLEAAVDAHRQIETGRTRGKIVLKVRD